MVNDHGPLSGSVNDQTSVNSKLVSTVWSGPAFTAGAVLGVTQFTENVVLAVPPAGTEIVRGLEPLTVQLLATPDSATL